MGVRIVVADGEDFRREGIVSCIKNYMQDSTIVAQISHGRDLQSAVEEHKADLVITEIALPGIVLFEVVREFISLRKARVVCLVGRTEVQLIPPLAHVGACCLFRDDPHEKCIADLRACLSSKWPIALPGMPKSVERLTPRQQEVYLLTLRGMSSKEVGKRLEMSSRTVEWHRKNIADVLLDPVTCPTNT